MRNLLAIAVFLCSACAHVDESERTAPGAVYMPLSMCAKKGAVAASNDAPGHRMMCEREEPLGSHYPRCVCRDEAAIAADRAATRQGIDDLGAVKCVSHDTANCGG
ncbi:MAG TPA: hypothetical protein VLW85_21405 [Myxococcales bacterium]|nr:hypothetical protein [Myxococcales bacterium]